MNPVYTKSLKKMDEFDRQLTCENFRGSVNIRHLDGSVFKLKNVLLKEERIDSFEMVLVWTEHCGNFAFFKDDLKSWSYKT